MKSASLATLWQEEKLHVEDGVDEEEEDPTEGESVVDLGLIPSDEWWWLWRAASGTIASLTWLLLWFPLTMHVTDVTGIETRFTWTPLLSVSHMMTERVLKEWDHLTGVKAHLATQTITCYSSDFTSSEIFEMRDTNETEQRFQDKNWKTADTLKMIPDNKILFSCQRQTHRQSVQVTNRVWKGWTRDTDCAHFLFLIFLFSLQTFVIDTGKDNYRTSYYTQDMSTFRREFKPTQLQNYQITIH